MQYERQFIEVRKKIKILDRCVVGGVLVLLASCGEGGGEGAPTPTPTPTPNNATIFVSVSGLRSGQNITLTNNSSDRLTISANGSFSFSNPVDLGQSYVVTISTPPTGETCTLNGAAGAATVAVITVTVSCGPTILHSFSGSDGGSDENVFTHSPNIILAADGNMYGTIVRGGSGDFGTIFKLTPAGVLTVLHNFNGSADGKYPEASLVEGPGGELYGTTTQGGLSGAGTLFKITRGGTFTLLHSLGGADGVVSPKAALIQEGGDLYGTSYSGGKHGAGTVFKFTMSNGMVSVIYSFNGVDGRLPEAPLVRTSDGNFYGTTSSGGSKDYGRVFKITPSGILTALHDFDGADGTYLYGPLVRDENDNVFGTAYSAMPGMAANSSGNVFKLSASGTYSVLHQFNGADGAWPIGGLTFGIDGNIYGTTSVGGAGRVTTGTIFRITPTGEFTTLHTFGGGPAGRVPRAPLVHDRSGIIYGTTSGGGTNNLGTVFKF